MSFIDKKIQPHNHYITTAFAIFGSLSVSMLYDNDFYTIYHLDITFELNFVLNFTKIINNE